MFALGDQARIRELVTAAGFGDPEVEEIAFEFRYPDEDYFWETLVRLAGGVSTAIAELDEDEREAARVAVVDAMADFRQDDGSYAVPAFQLGRARALSRDATGIGGRGTIALVEPRGGQPCPSTAKSATPPPRASRTRRSPPRRHRPVRRGGERRQRAALAGVSKRAGPLE